jgi:molybdopterin converting factor small subunit
MLTSEQQQQQHQTTTITTKSPEIQFTRGLSVFLDPFPTSLNESKSDLPSTTNLDLNNSEKTYDLTDYISTTTLTQLEPVRPATPAKEMIVQQQQQNAMAAMNECSMDSSCSSSSKEVTVTTTRVPNKRGRKPASTTSVLQAKKFGKYELVAEDNKTKTLVYFGNKRVEVGTAEYEKRRANNNDAVKKCRQKMEQEQREREAKMQALVDENRRLNEKVNTMSKEMEVLKGIIISMKPDNTLPEFIQRPLNDL